MNQRRRPFTSGDFVNESRDSSLNENAAYSRIVPASISDSRQPLEVDSRTQPVLYDTPPSSIGQSYYQSVSRSTPVRRPRPETAIPFEEYRQRLLSSSLPATISSRNSSDQPSFYSVEEHHDALTQPSTTHQYATLRRAPQNDNSSVSGSFGQNPKSKNDDHLFAAVESLLAQHLPSPSSSRSFSYQQKDYSSSAPRTSSRAAALREARTTETSNTNTQRPAHFPAPATTPITQQPTSTTPFNKPQVYRAEEREIERVTYLPVGSPGGQDSSNRLRYPIFELSVPKSTTPRSSSFDFSLSDDSRLLSSWSRSSSSHHRDHSQPNQSDHRKRFSSPPQDTVKTSSHRLQSSNIYSEFDSLSSALNRSFYDQPDSISGGGGSSSSSNTLTKHKLLDISSLDALLESGLGQYDSEDMSKSTKEWRSSFSSMRDRFGSSGIGDEFTQHFAGFTTNGSLTLPRRGVTKSASQGSVTLGRHSESTLLGRNNSLLAEAVDAIERRAAESPELIRRNSRQELGNFWAETLRNSSTPGGQPAGDPLAKQPGVEPGEAESLYTLVDSVSGSVTVQRTPAQLSAAQRLEMLHESLDVHSGDTRYSRGERFAARRAQFLKETVHSNTSSASTIASERAPTGRSTPMPNGYMNETTFRIDITEQETKVMENSGAPNFSALDNAVAELSTGSRTFTSIRSGGCARFPTGDLTSLSPNRKDTSSTSAQPHSPSPDAGSDASSNYNAPSGLPHPKPKHNIREQLIQAGFELRGFSYTRSFSARFASSPNFPVPSNGSVASRISEFEKRPGAPNLLQIACALSGIPQRNDGGPPMRSPVGPMSPRSSVYRTKPIIHADLGGSSPKPHVETIGSPTSVFEFPPSKQLFDVKVYFRE
ncbi:unnamed protein product [Toxocara canis]|uniref:Rab-GAP TBC domain-containing protein n=1 Tax=Toxocara canis TaxID=6265 RepID=A0A183TW35_TOXCA|nr:unnamed protein product [Toxocara canis]